MFLISALLNARSDTLGKGFGVRKNKHNGNATFLIGLGWFLTDFLASGRSLIWCYFGGRLLVSFGCFGVFSVPLTCFFLVWGTSFSWGTLSPQTLRITYTTIIQKTQVKSTAAFHGAQPPLGLEDPYTTLVPTEVGVKGDSNEAFPFSSHFTMTVVSYFSIHHVLCASLTAGNQ